MAFNFRWCYKLLIMKIYIVTREHPVIKEGCIIQETNQKVFDNENDEIGVYSLKSMNNTFIDHIINVPILENIEDGWIKEIGNNKKWTENEIKAHEFLDHKLIPDVSPLINRNFAANMIAEYHEIELKKLGLKLSNP